VVLDSITKNELPRCIQQWERSLAQFIKLKGTTLKGTIPTCNYAETKIVI
jgi:hypothetical protein